MWRLDPSPVHSDRDPVTVPSKIISAFVTSSSKVGGITVVARAAGSASAASERRIKERNNFITGYLVIDSKKRNGRRKRENVRSSAHGNLRIEIEHFDERDTRCAVYAPDDRGII